MASIFLVRSLRLALCVQHDKVFDLGAFTIADGVVRRAFHRPNGETSTLTFMVYLNDGVAGGCTAFNLRREGVVRDTDQMLRVMPTAGMALVFRHDVLHTGEVVLDGVKYVVRSDVMCRRRLDS